MNKNIILLLFSLTLCAPITAQSNYNFEAEEHFERGRAMVLAHRFQEASALWDSITQLPIRPDSKAKYLAINGILTRDSLHNPTKAAQYFSQAEALYPDIAKLDNASIDMGIVYASMGLAAMAEEKKQYDTAILHYEKAIDLINHTLMQNMIGIGMSSNDLTLMLHSFKQSRAIDFGHSHQFEDAESAFEELKFNYGQMELSTDPEIIMQGWMFGCLTRLQFAIMYEQDKGDLTLAQAESSTLLDKLLRGLTADDPAIIEGLSYQMPMFLYNIARIDIKTSNPTQALKLCQNALTWTSADQWRPNILDVQGQAHLALNQEPEARQCWEELLKINPQFYDPQPNATLNKKFGKK